MSRRADAPVVTAVAVTAPIAWDDKYRELARRAVSQLCGVVSVEHTADVTVVNSRYRNDSGEGAYVEARIYVPAPAGRTDG